MGNPRTSNGHATELQDHQRATRRLLAALTKEQAASAKSVAG